MKNVTNQLSTGVGQQNTTTKVKLTFEKTGFNADKTAWDYSLFINGKDSGFATTEFGNVYAVFGGGRLLLDDLKSLAAAKRFILKMARPIIDALVGQ